MAFVNDTDLASTAPGKGAAMVGFLQDAAGAIDRTALEKLTEIKTFEDFGAIGDGQISGAGTDDTAAIQAAIDWANGATWRAIHVLAKNYLCGQITTHPGTTLIGTGRQTSNIVCKNGVSGKWWSDRGNGAQKLMLSGLAFYARGQTSVTHIAYFGDTPPDGVQFGTEGLIAGCWFRDAPEGTALQINGNVGTINDVTCESAKYGIRVLGNANHLRNIYIMQAGEDATIKSEAIAAELYGCFVEGMHIEATASGALPLKMNGDVVIRDITISSAAGSIFSHLIEVDETTYINWAVHDILLLPSTPGYTVTNGMVKIGSAFSGGTSHYAFTGTSYQRSVNLHKGELRLRDQVYQAFSIRLRNNSGTIEHRIGSLAESATPGNYASRIINATTNFTATPAGTDASTPFAAGAKISSAAANRLILDTNAQIGAGFTMKAGIQYNDAGTALTVWAYPISINVNGLTRARLILEFRDAATGAPFNLTTGLANGKILSLWVEGFMV